MPKTRSRKGGKLTSVRESRKNPAPSVSTSTTTAEDKATSPRVTPTIAVDSACDLLSNIHEDCEAMQLSREFRNLCSPHANPSYAASMQKYMRNQFTFFGIKAPERRQLQKQFTETHREKLTCHNFLLQFVVSLWQQEERECQLYGVDLMSQFRKEALGETKAEYEEAIACAEILLTNKSWWDTVDLLASQSEQACYERYEPLHSMPEHPQIRTPQQSGHPSN